MRENWKWIVGTTIFVLACVVMYSAKCLLQSKGPVAFATPIETLKFDGGYELEILQVGVGEVTDGGAAPTGGLFSVRGNSSGSRGGGGATVSYQSSNGVLQELTFSASNNGALVVEVKPDSGSKLRILGNQGNVYDVTGGDRNRVDKFTGAEAMITGVETACVPDVLLQVRTSSGEWVNGYQTRFHEEDTERRTAFIFNAWPRNEQVLSMRGIVHGEPIIEFSLENPSPQVGKQAWSSQPLPAVYKDAEVEFTLRSMTGEFVQGKGIELDQQVDLVSTVHGVDNAYDYQLDTIVGDMGSAGNYVDPSNTCFQLAYTLSPSESFPYQRKKAVMVAKVKIDAAGNFGKLTQLKAPIPTQTVALKPTKQGCEFTIDFHWKNENELKRSLRALSVTDWVESRLCVFVDGAALSSGEVRTYGSSSSRSGGDTEMSSEWRVNAPFKAGQTIEFGFIAPAPKKHVRFTVDR